MTVSNLLVFSIMFSSLNNSWRHSLLMCGRSISTTLHKAILLLALENTIATDEHIWDLSRMNNGFISSFHYGHDRIKQFLILLINFTLSVILYLGSQYLYMSILLGARLVCNFFHIDDVVNEMLPLLSRYQYSCNVLLIVYAISLSVEHFSLLNYILFVKFIEKK